MQKNFRMTKEQVNELKSLANTLGVSQSDAIQTAIHFAIQNLGQSYTSNQEKNQQKTEQSELKNLLVKQLEEKDAQLAIKDMQIEKLASALSSAQEIAKAAQALNAADKPLPLDSGGETSKPTRWQRLKAAWRS